MSDVKIFVENLFLGDKLDGSKIYDECVCLHDENLESIKIFKILRNDVNLTNLIEFVFDSITNKKSVFVFGSDIEIYIFSISFLRRWNKYPLEKAISYINSTLFFGRKLKVPIYASNQISRYEPPLCVLVCGSRSVSYAFDNVIERELKKLPQKSIIYCGLKKGVDTRTRKICQKIGLYVELYSKDDDISLLNLDSVFSFHEDIENSTDTKKILYEAAACNVTNVFTFDLKNKEKFDGNKFINIEYI